MVLMIQTPMMTECEAMMMSMSLSFTHLEFCLWQAAQNTA
jgi:hypothetical protein